MCSLYTEDLVRNEVKTDNDDAKDSSVQLSPADAFRGNWLVKNWLTAIPLVGGFFKTADLEKAFNHMGHSIFMLAGMASFMEFGPIPSSEDDSAAIMQVKMTANMAIGMMAGEMAWNTIFSLSKSAVKSCKSACVKDLGESDAYQPMP